MDLKEDDVLTFDYPVERPVDLSINGKIKFRGGIVSTAGSALDEARAGPASRHLPCA
jgi:Type III flagellar switch regulator (C-ring) FliN C-term